MHSDLVLIAYLMLVVALDLLSVMIFVYRTKIKTLEDKLHPILTSLVLIQSKSMT